jgi:magnesium transporter
MPPGAIWIDLFAPTVEEDCMVEEFVGAPIPTKADPDYTEPPETHYAENGVRYMHASVLSEPEDTPDITGVTFVIAPKTLVTVRYHPVESFDVFAQKLCKTPGQALFPDAVAVGLINTVLNRSARALSKSGESLDRIASAVFRAKGDQSRRSQIYSDTLNALGREDEKISNLRESMVSTRAASAAIRADDGESSSRANFPRKPRTLAEQTQRVGVPDRNNVRNCPLVTIDRRFP